MCRTEHTQIILTFTHFQKADRAKDKTTPHSWVLCMHPPMQQEKIYQKSLRDPSVLRRVLTHHSNRAMLAHATCRYCWRGPGCEYKAACDQPQHDSCVVECVSGCGSCTARLVKFNVFSCMWSVALWEASRGAMPVE